VTAVFWTPEARQDLQGIYDYIAAESPHYAGLVADHIIGAIGRLERFPESGRIVPELKRSDVREVLWRSYRIVYRLIEQDQAHVLTVFRSERLFTDLRIVGGPA
jgi:plasmid stabilization system protein ParE